MHRKPTAAGKSSFDLIDVERFFTTLNLSEKTTFLDLACGAGNYALAVAERIGGTVHAVDLWADGIDRLNQQAEARNLANIEAAVCDVSRSLPLETDSVDICLMATVLHDLIQDGIHTGALKEVVRVLKPDSRLAVVEFKKQPGPPGPPEHIRLSPEELDAVLVPLGFQGRETVDLGAAVYMSLYHRE
ncbi:Ubiquinone/menaquinone biosynthesis methyltransferase UbiE [Desulfosarcina cetonica]|uniref:class I SAM-dependent methyltransferase n=1 Tax=Desulfosarcina cetonica TaxID=90730 RepID=UPI0006D03A84|nr:class I SAM-dependent methyltransferase [Desulfosarcina cetonica]VTR68094.1 Ubiquinone/menaquinone biosynthesis methyltransferase UbiE [Desulfosarcina cetonica]